MRIAYAFAMAEPVSGVLLLENLGNFSLGQSVVTSEKVRLFFLCELVLDSLCIRLASAGESSEYLPSVFVTCFPDAE